MTLRPHLDTAARRARLVDRHHLARTAAARGRYAPRERRRVRAWLGEELPAGTVDTWLTEVETSALAVLAVLAGHDRPRCNGNSPAPDPHHDGPRRRSPTRHVTGPVR